MGAGHKAHCRVLGWVGALLGARNRCPLGHFRREGVVVRIGGAKQAALGARLLWNVPKYFFHWVGATSCHSFLLEHPFWQ